MVANRYIKMIIAVVLAVALVLVVREWLAVQTVVGRNVPVTGIVLSAEEKAAEHEAARLARVRKAEVDRLNGAADAYLNEILRAEQLRKAEIDRWNALAKYYREKQEQEAARQERVRRAEIDRWSALAEYYLNKQAGAGK